MIRKIGQSTVDYRATTDNEVEPIIVEKIIKAIKKIKNGKEAGPGNILIELVKYGTEYLLQKMAEIFNKCLLEGHHIPENWGLIYIDSIYKIGNKK